MNTATIPSITTDRPAPLPRRRDALLGRHASFLLYAAIGVGALAIDVGIYALLALGGGWHPLLAHTVSTAVAAIASFLANSYINFKVTDRLLLRFLSFGVVVFIGYVVSSVVIGVGIDVFALDPLIAKAISLPIVLVLQFTLNTRITFKSSTERTEQ